VGTTAPNYSLKRTLRISQLNGLDCATGRSTSPLRAGAILFKRAPIFIAFRALQALLAS
jgi:hypothetical protein